MTPAGARRAGLLVVVLAAVLFHVRGLAGEFTFDDHRFVDRNAAIGTVGNPLRFFTDPTTADPRQASDIYRPLRTLSFAVERSIFGDRPAGFHAVSLVLHAANAGLLYLLLLELGAGAAAAAFGAGVFAAHPANVEAVAWISSRADLMAAFFTLLAVIGWVRTRGPDRWYALALGAGLAACFSKEAAVVFPGFFVLADLARPGGGRREALSRWRLFLLPTLLALGFALWVKVLLESGRSGILGHIPGWWGGSYGANLGTAVRAGAYQALFAAFPFVPSLDWYMDLSRSLLEPGALASALLLAALLALGLRGALRGGPPAALAGSGILWALLGGLLTSHLLFPVGIPRADRFLYLSLAGAAAVAAAGFQRAFSFHPRGAMLLGGAAVLGLGLLAADRTGAWRDEATMWSLAPAEGYSPRARGWFIARRTRHAARTFDRGVEALDAGEGERARRLLAESRGELEVLLSEVKVLRDEWRERTGLEVDARFEARIRRNLSRVLFRSGDAEGALREAEASSVLDPGDSRSLALEAIALERLGRLQEAGWRMEAALAAAPPAGPFLPGAEDEGLVPPLDAAAVLVPVARWRLSRGYDGAALRALRAAARAWPEPGRNPAVEQAPDLEAQIGARRSALEAAARADPGNAALAAARVAYVGMGSADMEAARMAYRATFGVGMEGPSLRTLWALATMEADDTEEGWKAADAHHGATLEEFPGDAGALLGKARCAASLRRPEEAASLRRRVLADPAATEEALREAREGLDGGGR